MLFDRVRVLITVSFKAIREILFPELFSMISSSPLILDPMNSFRALSRNLQTKTFFFRSSHGLMNAQTLRSFSNTKSEDEQGFEANQSTRSTYTTYALLAGGAVVAYGGTALVWDVMALSPLMSAKYGFYAGGLTSAASFGMGAIGLRNMTIDTVNINRWSTKIVNASTTCKSLLGGTGKVTHFLACIPSSLRHFLTPLLFFAMIHHSDT